MGGAGKDRAAGRRRGGGAAGGGGYGTFISAAPSDVILSLRCDISAFEDAIARVFDGIGWPANPDAGLLTLWSRYHAEPYSAVSKFPDSHLPGSAPEPDATDSEPPASHS